MKNALIILIACLMTCSQGQVAWAQLTGTGCIGQTQYTNGSANDPIYYYPAGVNGELTAVPTAGTPGWNFVWSKFTVGQSSWVLYNTTNNAPSSTITNLTPGAYKVSIFDANNNNVGCYTAWILQILQEPNVDVQPIPPGCTGPINLIGTIIPGQISPYSNLPANTMLLDANTQISICFSGTHTWVSDLAFYVRGPASCGSPTVLLSPNPGANGQGSVCNSGNNINNLCFSSESNATLNVCNPAPATLQGTYGRYGPGAGTPINWNPLFGCDASNGGWSVQIYDCIGGDTGSLTDATLTFTGTSVCGASQTVTYSTPNNYSSFIADNSCSSASASIFTVTPSIPPPIACTIGYEWTSEPPVNIPNATSSLNITLNNLTSPSGQPMAWQDVSFTLALTSTCDSIGANNACFGGNSEDTELFDYYQPQAADITPVGPVCVVDAPITLQSTLIGGTWSGPGVIDPVLGIFDPSIMGAGFYDVWYQVNDPCIAPGFTTIEVQAVPNYPFTIQPAVCLDATPINLAIDNPQGGTFTGNGIADLTLGLFDPILAGVGVHTITWDVPGVCPTSYTQDIEVWALPPVDAGLDVNVCDGDEQALQATGAVDFQWTPSNILDNANLSNPNATINATMVLTVTGTDANGCQAMDDVTLTWIPITTPTITAVGPLCEAGASVNLVVDVAGGTWSGSGITDPINGVFSPAVSGDGSIAVQYDLGWQCSVVASINIVVEAVPSTTLSAPLHVCIDGPVVQLAQLNQSVGTYVGNGIQNITTGTFNPQTAGIGSQIITWNIPGVCPISPTATINVHALPSVNAGLDDDACYGLPYPLAASGAFTYTWTPTVYLNNPNVASPNATITSNQTFTVTGTDIYGCVNSDQVSLTVLPLPQVSTQSTGMICPGSPTPLAAVGSAGTFSWLPNSAITNANTANPTVSPMSTTIYTVTLTDGCGLTAQAQATVPVETIYTVLAGNDAAFCEGTSTVLVATIQPFDAQFNWSTSNGQLNGTGDQIQLLVDVEGDYELHAITPLGCPYDDVVHADEVLLPVISMADSVDLCPASTVTLQAGNNWDQVQWAHGPTTGQVIVAQAGDYYVTVTNSGCSSSDSITVVQVVLPYLELGPDVEICQGTLATLDAGVIGDWSNGATAASISVSQEGTYEVEVRDGFCSVMDSVHVTVKPLPVLDLESDIIGCIDEIVFLYAGHPYNDAYIWSTGETVPMIEVTAPGVYWVTATNECGSVSDQSDVYFQDCSYAVYMPSSFTPDADGINDEWKMTTYNMKEVEVVILNRWGQEVFRSNDAQAAWTGNVAGGDYFSPDGVYAVQFKGTTIKDEVVERSSTIIMIR